MPCRAGWLLMAAKCLCARRPTGRMWASPLATSDGVYLAAVSKADQKNARVVQFEAANRYGSGSLLWKAKAKGAVAAAGAAIRGSPQWLSHELYYGRADNLFVAQNTLSGDETYRVASKDGLTGAVNHGAATLAYVRLMPAPLSCPRRLGAKTRHL